jgi:hypothetical protein
LCSKADPDLRVYEYTVLIVATALGRVQCAALLDTMILGKVVADQSLKAVLSTHIQEDQIRRIPDQAKRDEISGIPRTASPTGAAVWDYSNWDEAKFD